MPKRKTQAEKAETFRALHLDTRLLVLPNIWDPLGARMLQALGFPAVATASAAIANSLGLPDGQQIRFDTMLETIRRIAASIDVPLSADIERGYADDPAGIAHNVREVLRAGAVGINLEDSVAEGGGLQSIPSQCERIAAVRSMASAEGIPLVINARTDLFLADVRGSTQDRIDEAVTRGKAYMEAGADCIYPIGASDLDTLKSIRAGTLAPINVYAHGTAPPMPDLESAGISRLSLGPNLLRAAMGTMKRVAVQLRDHGSYAVFSDDALSSEEIEEYVDPPSADR